MTMRMQCCSECGEVNYPARQICRRCLAERLTEQEVADTGKLLAVSTLHRSLEPAFDAALPMRIATVKLDCGPQVIAFVSVDLAPGDRVRLKSTRSLLNHPTWEAWPLLEREANNAPNAAPADRPP